MKDVDWSLIWPLIALQVVLAIIGLFSLRKTETTMGPKWVWAIVILFGNLVGSILYFTVGRKNI